MTTSGQPTIRNVAIALNAPHALLNSTAYAYTEDVCTKSRIARKRTCIAHALVLFNVYGVPLSYGPYLEYYYNTTTYGTPSLVCISIPQAAQLLCLYAAPLPITWLYQRGYWRGSIYWSTFAICICQLMPIVCKSWLHLLIVRGIVQGTALGSLGTASTLCLASHYRNNIPVASMIGSSIALLGPLAYSAIAYIFLPAFQHSNACHANFGISAATLGLAAYLIKKDAHFTTLNIVSNKARHPRSIFRLSKETGAFLLGYWLLSTGVYVYPTFIVLLHASAPGLVRPGTATLHLLTMYAVAAPFAALAGSSWLRTGLGAVNAFVCAANVGAAAYVLPAFMPFATVSLASTLVYGACLGTILALSMRVIYTVSPFNGDGNFTAPHAQIGLVLAVSGVLAAMGIVIVALMVDCGDQGFRWAFVVMGIMVFVGGCLMGIGRMVGMGWTVFGVV